MRGLSANGVKGSPIQVDFEELCYAFRTYSFCTVPRVIYNHYRSRSREGYRLNMGS